MAMGGSISPVRAHGRGQTVPADAAALLSRSLPTFPSASLAPATSTASSGGLRPYALSRHPGTADKNFPKEDVPIMSIFAPYSERAAGARGRGRVGAGTDGDHLRSVSPHRRPRRGTTTPGGAATGSRRAFSPHTAAAVAVGSGSPTMTHSFGVGTDTGAGTGTDVDAGDGEELAMAAGRSTSPLAAAAAAGTNIDDIDDGDDGDGGGGGEGLALGGALDNDSPRLPPPRHAPDAAAAVPADEAPTTAAVAAAASSVASVVSSAAGRSTARQPVPLNPHGVVTVDGGLLNAVGNGSGRRGRSQPKSRGQRALPTPVDAATAIVAMTAGGLHDLSWSMTDSLGGEGEGSLGRYLLSIYLGPYLDPYLGPYLGPYLKGEGSLGRYDRPLSPTGPWQPASELCFGRVPSGVCMCARADLHPRHPFSSFRTDSCPLRVPSLCLPPPPPPRS